MTARVHYMTVILNEDTRIDDIKATAEAIQQFRNVERVVLGEVTGETVVARLKVTSELREGVHRAVDSAFNLLDPAR